MSKDKPFPEEPPHTGEVHTSQEGTKALSAPTEQEMRETFHQIRDLYHPPPELFARLHQIPEEHPQRRAGWRWLWGAMVPLMASTAVVLLAIWPPSIETKQDAGLRPKGESWRALYAHKKSTTSQVLSQELRDGVVLHPGDLLQFTYASGARYAMLVGANEKGELYQLYPRGGNLAVRLNKTRGALPQEAGRSGSFRLDGYIGWERFYVLTRMTSFSFGEVRSSFRTMWLTGKHDLRTLRCIKGPWSCRSFLIQKRAR